MTCPMCDGKGWQWVGDADNAHREECELCQGKGSGNVDWATVVGIIAPLAVWALVLGCISLLPQMGS